LLGVLFSLVAQVGRGPADAGFLCPAGTTEAVRAATGCRSMIQLDVED
jgi:hypothetical protein